MSAAEKFDGDELGVLADLRISDILMNQGTQPRDDLPNAKIIEYSELMRTGTIFPPVVVFKDKFGKLYLGDGFIRITSAKANGSDTIRSCVRDGSARDALLYGYKVNSRHGLALSRADQERAVMRLLDDSEWGNWTDKRIAEIVGVSPDFVSSRRPYSVNPNARSPFRIVDDVDGKSKVIKVREKQPKKPSITSTRKPLPLPVHGLPASERQFNGNPVEFRSVPSLRNQVIRALRSKGERVREHVKCGIGYADIVTDSAIYFVVPVLTCGAFQQQFAISLLIRDCMIAETEKPNFKLRSVIVGEMTDAISPWIDYAKKYGIEIVSKI